MRLGCKCRGCVRKCGIRSIPRATLGGTPRRLGVPRVETLVADSLDVRAIRLNASGAIGATQEAFAQAIGVPVRTLRNWEQRRRKPTGPARVLLALIAFNPWIVFDSLNRTGR